MKMYFLLITLVLASCIETPDLHQNNPFYSNEKPYLYPYEKEAKDVVAEIRIRTVSNDVAKAQLTAEIPFLKHNKSWLLLLTQDDCVHAAYSTTWAAINGKPLSEKHFYNSEQLRYGDLPPDIHQLGKTLGSTDGCNNEVRFSFTTTLCPDQKWMNEKAEIKPGYTKNYYRFYKKNGLTWSNVCEMLNYGCGIAFHNLNIASQSENMILKYLPAAQDSILKHLNGRGCKALTEPDGNKNYVYAARRYEPIRVMTAQAGATKIYPFMVNDRLSQVLMERWFNDRPTYFKNLIKTEMQQPQNERKAIHIGVHSTDFNWVNLFLWLNNTYGKDGDDSVWAPSMEEYYEYNYYRTVGGNPLIEQEDDNTFKLTVKLPSQLYFYYPSVTVNLKGLKMKNIASVTSNDAVTGLSYADYAEGIMLNIDCRRFLLEHATHFVEVYEQDKSNTSNRADALYFVNMLKASPQKEALLKRLQP